MDQAYDLHQRPSPRSVALSNLNEKELHFPTNHQNTA